MAGAPPMPTTTLVTADHIKTFGDMQEIKSQMKNHEMSQILMQWIICWFRVFQIKFDIFSNLKPKIDTNEYLYSYLTKLI